VTEPAEPSTVRVEVCCGVGGVGKTTTAAALAVGNALAGHRVVVLTIDPAKRLADALSVEELGNEPSEVDLSELEAEGAGTLHALMLDRKKTFDDVIRRFTPSADVAERLLDNRYYRAVSERLGGSQEYMAMEKLYDLVHDGRWDVVVVDTPPTQHALDFFKAPERVRRVFDRSVLGALVQPKRGLLAMTTRRIAKTAQRMVGDRVMNDIGEFFQLIAGLSAGFRDRGEAVYGLLRATETRYYLVASAAAPERTDALAFLETLKGDGMQFSGFVVNRVFPDPHVPEVHIEELPGAPEDIDETAWHGALEALLHLKDEAQETVRAHRAAIAELSEHVPEAPVWQVPDLGDGVRNLGGLAEMSAWLPPNEERVVV